MKIDNTSDRDKKKKKKKENRKQSDLETMIFSIMQKSLKSAMDAALDDIFKEWKFK